ncbi:hypothetical protein FNH22_05210 [Fulvivirga sp. M361]|uniref:hypothetical protein n=1 Tax=Fulvivirga sp. M361 TaxID=2594266 RepID=UPI00117B2356|nr:hypothetical protein [Fulvivirga sp. M361]TRX61454.1 hypothetical protein FNH22_05210 [Fulvivirga sp. M361]
MSPTQGQMLAIETPRPFSFETYGMESDFYNSPSIPNSVSQISTFPDYTRQGGLTRHQVNLQSVENDIKAYNDRKAQTASLMAEIDQAMSARSINYTFPNLNNDARHQRFERALDQLSLMLDDQQPLDITKAVSIVENAYDPSVTYQDLKRQVQNLAFLSDYILKTKGLPEGDNLSKVMSMFHVMADTTTITLEGQEFEQTFYPLLYDFDDPWGRQDYSKMFVSKLLRFGTGNCNSLPRLFLMVAEELNVDVSLAFAPNHSYIKFQDRYGEWHNIELTNQMLTTDDIIMESGWVKAEAIRSGIYMNPLTKKEIIAQSVNDLALAHEKLFGPSEFSLRCANLALKYNSKSITAHQIKASYHTSLLRYVVEQYNQQKRSKTAFFQDKKAIAIKSKMETDYQIIDDLGFSEIPEEVYNQWIKAMDNEGNRQASRTRQREMLNSLNKY